MIANTLNRMARTINGLGEDFLEGARKSKNLHEKLVYETAQKYLGSRLGVSVIVQGRDEQNVYVPKEKAAFALPFKPALYFE